MLFTNSFFVELLHLVLVDTAHCSLASPRLPQLTGHFVSIDILLTMKHVFLLNSRLGSGYWAGAMDPVVSSPTPEEFLLDVKAIQSLEP